MSKTVLVREPATGIEYDLYRELGKVLRRFGVYLYKHQDALNMIVSDEPVTAELLQESIYPNYDMETVRAIWHDYEQLF